MNTALPSASRVATVASCVVLSAGVLSAGACGSSPPAAGSGTPVPDNTATALWTGALCSDVGALRASVDQFADVVVAPGMADEMTSDLTNLKAHLSAVVNDARGQWLAETTALSTALDNLRATVGALAATPSGDAAAAVRVAVAQVRTAAQGLLNAIRPACPSAEPSLSA